MQNKKQKNRHPNDESTRRNFLKKVAWSVPTIFALGQIIKPDKIYADSSVEGAPDDWWE
jgi:hypothetical protein